MANMESRITGLVVAALLVLTACSAEVLSDDAPSPDTTSTTSPIPDVARPEGSVLVKVTGPVQVGPGGIQEICAGQGDTCAGIPLSGDLVEPDSEAAVQQVTGWYDGSQLLVIESGIPASSPFSDSDFSTPCAGLQGPATANPPDDPMNAILAYTETIPNRYAGMWWDGANAVLTVWLTGQDIESHRSALEQAAGDDLTVCVIDGAEYSEASLLEIQARLFEVIDLEATATRATSVGTLTNRVEVMMEYLDADTRSRIESEFGTAVEFYAFMEVLDGAIADLPGQTPAHPGDVELLTQPNRAGGGMGALGTFELRFDADFGCVYFPGDETDAGDNGRTVPVWPFGYTAESDPLRIYDHDGVLVAQEGDVIQMGGGFVEYVTDRELCGAAGAWIMSSRPVVVDS
jgi:hypothetical protein